MKLDPFDIKILSRLQVEARISIANLAESIGLSPSPCHTRWRKLESLKYIRSYSAELDIDRIARCVTVMVPVELARHEAADFQRFEREIAKIPEVVECLAVGGGFDYLLRVVAADINCYQSVMERLLAGSCGIAKYYTYIVTKPIKRFSGYPVEVLLEGIVQKD